MYEEILEKYDPGTAPGQLPETALKLSWAGTAGFIIEYKGTTILIDPFVTRPGVWSVPFLKQRINEPLARETFPMADHILLGHSHYDHLQDIPVIAKHTGAPVYGSETTAMVLKAAGIDEWKTVKIRNWQKYDLDTVTVKFVPSIHGLILFGRVPFDGEITEPPPLPMKATEYKVGGTYGLLLEADGFRFAHFGSANMVDSELAKIGAIDLLMLGISGRQKTENYLRRMTEPTSPKYILAHHYDNFFKPLKLGRIPFKGVHLDEFIKEYEEICPEAKMIIPDFFQPVVFDTATGELLNS